VRTDKFHSLFALNDPFDERVASKILNGVFLPLSEAEMQFIRVPRFRRDLMGHWGNEEYLFIQISSGGEYSCSLFGVERKGVLRIDREAGVSVHQCYDLFTHEGISLRLEVSRRSDIPKTERDAIEVMFYEEQSHTYRMGAVLDKMVEQGSGGNGG
jgi:hypothetical protein